jgi:hypothetical protein
MKKLQRLRARAFYAQGGICCYCGTPMWLESPSELALRPRAAVFRQCTAEHLLARQDGGPDEPYNIAAACWLCNQIRHRRKKALSAEDFRALVRLRLANGRWWRPSRNGVKLISYPSLHPEMGSG